MAVLFGDGVGLWRLPRDPQELLQLVVLVRKVEVVVVLKQWKRKDDPYTALVHVIFGKNSTLLRDKLNCTVALVNCFL